MFTFSALRGQGEGYDHGCLQLFHSEKAACAVLGTVRSKKACVCDNGIVFGLRDELESRKQGGKGEKQGKKGRNGEERTKHDISILYLIPAAINRFEHF